MFFERLPEFIANHVMLVGIAVALLVALIGHEMGRWTRGYKALSPQQLVGMINRDNALVVDVSAMNQNGHVVGAKHVAMSQFDPENKELAKVRDLPVVIYCRTGQTSAEACKRLKKAGFSKVFWLDGGLSAWLTAELPVVKGAK